VASANDAPVAVDDTATTQKDTAVVIAVLTNDFDGDGDTLRIVEVSSMPPDKGTAAIDSNNIVYKPKNGFTGSVTLSYRTTDGSLVSNTATVTITVTRK